MHTHPFCLTGKRPFVEAGTSNYSFHGLLSDIERMFYLGDILLRRNMKVEDAIKLYIRSFTNVTVNSLTCIHVAKGLAYFSTIHLLSQKLQSKDK